ncbi:hypothetical protein BASA81_001224 [Batrachochytrium salamandrivorans]|nr:hypothetical protein BASA81_001224 [Batrachochytrium salamandrivorans]
MPLSDEEDGEGDELVKFDASAFDVSVNYSCSPEKVSIKPACLPNDDFLLDSEEGEEQAPLNTLELATANEEPATTPSYWWIVLCILPLGFVAYLLQHQPPCSGSSHKACTGVLKATLSRDKFHEDNAQCFDTLDLLDAELAVVFALRQFRRRFSPVLNLPSDNFTASERDSPLAGSWTILYRVPLGCT